MNSASNFISRLRSLGFNAVVMALAALMAASCADDNVGGADVTDPKAGYITIDLSNSSLPSRATEADVDALNENLIDNALVCLLPASASDTDVPLVIENVKVNQSTSATVQIRFRREIVDQLFPGTVNTARVYVVANLPESTPIPEGATLDQLRKLVVESDFASSAVQPSFVMDGESTVTIVRNPQSLSQSSISGAVELTRSAAKIGIAVKVAESVTDANGDTWEPLASGMSVLIANGVRRSAVTPSAYTPVADDYYSTATNNENPLHRSRPLNDSATGTYPYVLSQPFYTYPNSWGGNDEAMTYMTLMVPWKKAGEESYRTCYYTVPVLREGSDLVRNVSYRVNINVNILGSFTPNDPLELEDLSYRAVDWGKEDINVEIGDYRYLVLDRTEFIMNNDEMIHIPFYSSHNTTVKSVKMTYYRYNTTAAGLEKAIEITPEQNQRSTANVGDSIGQHLYSSWIVNAIDPNTKTRTLSFHHDLVQWTPVDARGTTLVLGPNNSGTYPNESTINTRISEIDHYTLPNNPEPAFSRYEIEIVIVHSDKVGTADESLFSETVKLVQYPQMYIEAVANKYTINNQQPYGASKLGNVYLNGNQSGNNAPVGLTGANRNPNMYIVSITQLNDSSYIIGDPRSTSIKNPRNHRYAYSTGRYVYESTENWNPAPALYGTSPRTLQYYYPTDNDTDKKFFVAPKIRVASSYGVSQPMSETAAISRCAAYQELDCPAGRWRLPTYGELEYIINLSNEGKIPVLFTSSSNYWSAHGAMQGQVDSNGHLVSYNGDANVRCVYDEWYWQDSKVSSSGTDTSNGVSFTKYPFTWGDKPRE